MTSEILKALMEISAICDEQRNCLNCPFRDDYAQYCGFSDRAPSEWRFKDWRGADDVMKIKEEANEND